ncbi:hypothetical protein [Streptomyces himalayensis]|uniref:Uncharacterized protein n=1 Tax=Streptomyces himalayensis subsp. himalayensis TaxID=2756131 RepID=A0A7W0DR01_9ACTN|nr:hypothetical protein [Streptomyces himalayensis]MBA2949275.1 hypothetical protein [Streptomyces himalayensis subsp. himalayensis]
MTTKQKVAVATGIISALILAGAPAAYANWTGSISGEGVGYESQRWADEQYSQLWLQDCSASNGSSSTNMRYYRDISFAPDPYYDDKTFTECFKGNNYLSMGEWHDLPSGEYYFQIMEIGGGSSGTLSVYKTSVDTTAAD